MVRYDKILIIINDKKCKYYIMVIILSHSESYEYIERQYYLLFCRLARVIYFDSTRASTYI